MGSRRSSEPAGAEATEVKQRAESTAHAALSAQSDTQQHMSHYQAEMANMKAMMQTLAENARTVEERHEREIADLRSAFERTLQEETEAIRHTC